MSVPLRRTPSNKPRRKPLATERWLDDVLNGRICRRCGKEGNHWSDGVENYGYSCDGYALDRPPTNQYPSDQESEG